LTQDILDRFQVASELEIDLYVGVELFDFLASLFGLGDRFLDP